MYGIDETIQDSASNAPMPTGINQNVTFKGATFEKLSEDKSPVLQYHFEDSEGRALKHTMWEVDVERVKDNAQQYPKNHSRDDIKLNFVKGAPITPDEAVIIAGRDFNAYNKHILNRFFTEEEIINATKGSSSYAQFAQNVVKLCNSKESFPPVRLIVVLSHNEKYHQLPKNHYNPFIELQSVTPSGLKLTKYHTITPSTVQASDPDSFNPADFAGDDNPPFSAEDATF